MFESPRVKVCHFTPGYVVLLVLSISALILSCGPKTEIRETLFTNGQVKEHWQVIRDDDQNYLAHGRYVSWYENGQKLQEETWVDGKLNGQFITWYENGMKKQAGYYVDGLMQGLYREWAPDGIKIVEGLMEAGKQQGKWTYWDENGNIFKQEDYQDGELIE